AIETIRSTGAASIDLRLGTWFSVPRPNRTGILRIFDESEKSTTAEVARTKNHYVPFGGQFVLHPRNFVLGVTLEWIRLPSTLGGYIVGRSSWGRRGLVIATASGVHPGFSGCLTLELTNLGEIPIEIRPGMPVSQLFLHQTTSGGASDQSKFVGLRRPIQG